MSRLALAPARPTPLTLYWRLATALRNQIEQGVLRVGDRLPSVRTLRRLYSVSAATAAEAYVVPEETQRRRIVTNHVKSPLSGAFRRNSPSSPWQPVAEVISRAARPEE